MQVRETTLQELLGGSKQFRVPLFQRTYTWRERDHTQLWRDILGQYEVARQNGLGATGSGHFIGSFVLAPTKISAALPAFLVVDGQQRLTTLTLALCALREAAAAKDPTAFERLTNQFLVNQYASGTDRWKLVPTYQDQEPYFSCINGEGAGAGNSLITDAYRFFEIQLSQLGPDDEPFDLALLEQVIVGGLSIVDITAQQGDNVHRIFESLNATGVGLTQADLLRNYLFMLLPTRDKVVFETVWRPMQDQLGSDNLEGLARVDLLRRGIDVRADDIYRAHQDRLASIEHDEAAIEAEIRDLALRAQHYERLLHPSVESDKSIRRGLRFLKRWQATTASPLVMYLYELREDGKIDAITVAAGLHQIESFLVRRLLVGVSTNNLNRIFIQLVAKLRRDEWTSIIDAIRTELSGERKYWASDDEVRAAAQTRPFYYYGRAQQRRMVLERIEESFGHKELGALEDLKLTVEHIMPQSLSEAWISAIAAMGDDPSDVHRERVHTLGNLTLSAYNSELSNSVFERKQQIYGESHLALNNALVESESWGRAEIEARAGELAERSIQIWDGPVEGVTDEPVGFDWSRLHAAVAAIPDGQWTSYGDLAALAGTSAQSVGAHVATAMGVPKAYRVLTADGTIAVGFHWDDADDQRDPHALLASEGVRFDRHGRADPDQRLSPDNLQSLIGWFDPDDDYPEGGDTDAEEGAA